jgi:DNA-directed RNA polymerase specialized sigma24 family protein
MESKDRIEKLLALLLLQQMKVGPQRDKALQLSLAGFTNTEIADLLQTTAAAVAQQLYETRRKPGQKRQTRPS